MTKLHVYTIRDMGKTKQKYRQEWEKEFDGQERDGQRVKIGEWSCSQASDQFSAYCKLCKVNIKVSSMGKQSLIQHAAKEKHKQHMKSIKSQQPLIANFAKPALASSCPEDKVLSAEMKWAAFLAEHDVPVNISENIQELFISMFPDSKIAQQFTCARTKATYLITDGFGYSVHSSLVDRLKETKFSILIDESNKIQGQKYLHILVRYFANEEQSVITEFYKAVIVNQGRAENIITAINAAFEEDNIPWNNVLQIMSDSPNVMRGSVKGVIAQIKKTYAPYLLDIGGCSLHHIHNTVSYATSAFGEEIESFVVDVFAFFKHRTGLCEEFKEAQAMCDVAEHRIMRFVSTRWLNILPIVSRLVEQWLALKRFFGSLGKNHPDVIKQDRTKCIMQHLNDPNMFVKLCFLQAVLPQFERFEKLFQAQGSRIHLLHAEMCELLRNLMAQFVSPKKLEDATTACCLLKIDFGRENQLSDNNLAIGKETAAALKELEMKEGDKKLFHLAVRAFYKTATEKLIHYLPLENQLLLDMKCLQPEKQKQGSSLRAISRIASTLAPLVPEVDVDRVEAEWRGYALDDLTKSVELADGDATKYWTSVLALKLPGGDPKYPSLAVVVKCCLSLAHGNADTERSFSETAKILTQHRNCLGPELLNGLMTVKSHLSVTGQKSHNMVMSPTLLKAGKNAHSRYTKRCSEVQKQERELQKKQKLAEAERELTEAMKKQVDEERKRKQLDDQEKAVKQKKAEAETLYAKAHSLMKEANVLMGKAQKKKKQSDQEERAAAKTQGRIMKRQLEKMAAEVASGSSNKKQKQS